MLRGQPGMPLRRRQTTTCFFDPGQEPSATTTAAQGAASFELARGRFAGGRDDIFPTGPSPLSFYQQQHHHHHHNHNDDDRPAACDRLATCRQPGRPPSPRSRPEAGRRPPPGPPCLQPRYRRIRAPHGRSRLDALVRPPGHGCRASRRWLHVGAQPAPDATPKPLGGLSSRTPPTRTRARRRRPLGA